jgi:hypothetical protein
LDTEFEWRKNPQDCRKLDRQTLWVEIARRLGRYDVFEEEDQGIKIRDGHLGSLLYSFRENREVVALSRGLVFIS